MPVAGPGSQQSTWTDRRDPELPSPVVPKLPPTALPASRYRLKTELDTMWIPVISTTVYPALITVYLMTDASTRVRLDGQYWILLRREQLDPEDQCMLIIYHITWRVSIRQGSYRNCVVFDIIVCKYGRRAYRVRDSLFHQFQGLI